MHKIKRTTQGVKVYICFGELSQTPLIKHKPNLSVDKKENLFKIPTKSNMANK